MEKSLLKREILPILGFPWRKTELQRKLLCSWVFQLRKKLLVKISRFKRAFFNGKTLSIPAV
jgi:hypothetical protein